MHILQFTVGGIYSSLPWDAYTLVYRGTHILQFTVGRIILQFTVGRTHILQFTVVRIQSSLPWYAYTLVYRGTHILQFTVGRIYSSLPWDAYTLVYRGTYILQFTVGRTHTLQFTVSFSIPGLAVPFKEIKLEWKMLQNSVTTAQKTVFWRSKKRDMAQRASGNHTNYKFMEWATYRLMGAGNVGYFCQYVLLSRQIFLAEVATVGFMVSPGGQSQLVTAQSGCTQSGQTLFPHLLVSCVRVHAPHHYTVFNNLHSTFTSLSKQDIINCLVCFRSRISIP